MGLFDFLKSKGDSTVAVVTEPHILYLPIEGEVIALECIDDGVFSAGILGQGCGIVPAGETVYAPANGTVINIANTKHAVGLLTDDGAEVLIHVGMDTVDMNGNGFEVLVKLNQKVKCGQPLLKFSTAKIKAAGHPSTTAFVITNSDELSQITILKTGNMGKLSAVIKAE